MSTRLTLSDLSPRHQAEVLRQIERNKPLGLARAEQVREVVTAKRIRQSGRGLNKTETAFSAHIRAAVEPVGRVLDQSLTLKLANGCRYTPDVVTVEPKMFGMAITAYEVKGFMRDDAVVKLKVAASAYPWIKFVLVTAADRTLTSWKMEGVKP